MQFNMRGLLYKVFIEFAAEFLIPLEKNHEVGNDGHFYDMVFLAEFTA